MSTTLFAFLGRRANIELQLPYLERILAENSDVHVDIWNLARTPEDDAYIRALPTSDRMSIRNDFHSSCPWTGFDNVYRWYANQYEYATTLFVKLDDDVLFLQTDRFREFCDIATVNPGAVTSALTINNGASTAREPALRAAFEQLGIPLLDVHESNAYAELAHSYMFEHWRTIIGNPLAAAPTGDWLSINCIAFNHHVMRTIADTVGKPSPRFIAGRDCRQWPDIGDEGVANTLPRIIVNGFLAAHLSYGPQKMTDEQANLWRKRYGEIAREYLSDNTAQVGSNT